MTLTCTILDLPKAAVSDCAAGKMYSKTGRATLLYRANYGTITAMRIDDIVNLNCKTS